MKLVGIHQPETYPYAGYFNKMLNSDVFVILDDVQFKKNNYQNRNRILSHGNINWITIPVDLKSRLDSTIRDTKISYNVDWKSRNIRQLEGAYSKCPYFNNIMPTLVELIDNSSDYIIDSNLEFILYIRDYLEIDTPIEFSSSMEINSSKNDLVLDICKYTGATHYLSGAGGKDYLDLSTFEENNIEVLYQVFHPSLEYSQKSNNFVPYLSVLDLIMNNSKEESLNYIAGAFSFAK